MKLLTMLVWAAAAVLGLILPSAAIAQPVGQCNDMTRGQAFVIFANGFMQQVGNPGNAGQSVRDPSGQVYLAFPSMTPMINGFFVDWQGRLVEINRFTGMRQIGVCQLPLPVDPRTQIPVPVAFPGYGVDVPGGGTVPVAQAFAQPDRPFGAPLITGQQQAIGCAQASAMNGGIDRARFGDCMVRQMLGSRETAAYDCARRGSDRNAVALCLVGALGGSNERSAAQAVAQCYGQYGQDWTRYPLCMADGQIGGDAGKLLACVQQQARTGNATVFGTAACYGAEAFDFNPEMQIIVGCAANTGGNPYAFAGCAGGQLTVRELDKCLTGGVGGPDGCFGPNNTIIRGLTDAGRLIGDQFGPNNDIVRTWNTAVNDLTRGPGPNNTAVVTLRNVANEVGRGTNNVAREIKKVLPRIRCC